MIPTGCLNGISSYILWCYSVFSSLDRLVIVCALVVVLSILIVALVKEKGIGLDKLHDRAGEHLSVWICPVGRRRVSFSTVLLPRPGGLRQE